MKELRFSRFWPCATIFPDGWCPGTATLAGKTYTCNKCAHEWDLDGHYPGYVPSPELCAVEGCEGERKARGMCSKHYQRWRKQNMHQVAQS